MQNQVYTACSAAVPGDKATPDQSIYTPFNPTASVDTPAGGFCFPVVSDGVTDYTLATPVAGDATAVLGFVERVINYANYTVTEAGTLVIPAGNTLTVAVSGDYYVAAPGTVVAGDTVYVDTSTGAVTTDTSGLATTWTYREAGDEGDIIIISNN